MKAHKRAVVVSAATTALLLAGCGGGGSGDSGATPGTTGSVDVTVHAQDPKYSFDSKLYTAKAGTVNFAYVNDGKENHDLLIEGVPASKFKLKVVGPNSTTSGSAQLAAGTYTIYCDIAGHRGAGMEAKLVVS
jgi:plastocyanin